MLRVGERLELLLPITLFLTAFLLCVNTGSACLLEGFDDRLV
jgi:hypothetical protein